MMKMQETRQLHDDSVVISYRKKEFISNFSSTTSICDNFISKILSQIEGKNKIYVTIGKGN